MKVIFFITFFLTAPLTFADYQKAMEKGNEKKTVSQKKQCTDYDQYKDVSMDEMKKIADAGSAKILDVNSLNSYNRSHIKGAHHFKTALKKKTLGMILGKDKNAAIVAYCGGKQCTAWQEAAKTACEMGYKNIRHFSEGISGWDKMMRVKTKKGKG